MANGEQESTSPLFFGERIGLLDVGASGDLPPQWRTHKANIDFTGFEPELSLYDVLRRRYPERSYFNCAVGAKTESRDFYITKKPEASSLFEPNLNLLRRFPDFERFEVSEVLNIQLNKIDDVVPKGRSIDFMKLHIQGAELDALKGAAYTLDKVLGRNCKMLGMRLEA